MRTIEKGVFLVKEDYFGSPRSLNLSQIVASLWHRPSRLETRTKECKLCASLRVFKPKGVMKVKHLNPRQTKVQGVPAAFYEGLSE